LIIVHPLHQTIAIQMQNVSTHNISSRVVAKTVSMVTV